MRETWADFAESTIDKQRGRRGCDRRRSVGRIARMYNQVKGRKLFASCDDDERSVAGLGRLVFVFRKQFCFRRTPNQQDVSEDMG